MIKIAICDDEKVFLDVIARNIQTCFDCLSVEIEIKTFQHSSSFLNHVKNNSIDVAFLDIDMPKKSGFDLASVLHKSSINTLIIFVTSKHDLVYDSFEYHPFFFVRKTSFQNMKDELHHISKKIYAYYKQSKQIDVQDIVAGTLPVTLSDIKYIQSEKHYLLYYLNSNSKTPFKERGTLDAKSLELLDYDFCRPHQRYLLNMRYIDNFSTILDRIVLTTGETIPLTKRQRETVLECYRIYRRK